MLRTVKIKAHSKLEALRKLGKNLRLFPDKLEVSGGLDMASQLSAGACHVPSLLTGLQRLNYSA